MTDDKPYRPNVGIALFNVTGQPAWSVNIRRSHQVTGFQHPQGWSASMSGRHGDHWLIQELQVMRRGRSSGIPQAVPCCLSAMN